MVKFRCQQSDKEFKAGRRVPGRQRIALHPMFYRGFSGRGHHGR